MPASRLRQKAGDAHRRHLPPPFPLARDRTEPGCRPVAPADGLRHPRHPCGRGRARCPGLCRGDPAQRVAGKACADLHGDGRLLHLPLRHRRPDPHPRPGPALLHRRRGADLERLRPAAEPGPAAAHPAGLPRRALHQLRARLGRGGDGGGQPALGGADPVPGPAARPRHGGRDRRAVPAWRPLGDAADHGGLAAAPLPPRPGGGVAGLASAGGADRGPAPPDRPPGRQRRGLGGPCPRPSPRGAGGDRVRPRHRHGPGGHARPAVAARRPGPAAAGGRRAALRGADRLVGADRDRPRPGAQGGGGRAAAGAAADPGGAVPGDPRRHRPAARADRARPRHGPARHRGGPGPAPHRHQHRRAPARGRQAEHARRLPARRRFRHDARPALARPDAAAGAGQPDLELGGAAPFAAHGGHRRPGAGGDAALLRQRIRPLAAHHRGGDAAALLRHHLAEGAGTGRRHGSRRAAGRRPGLRGA
ncbi:hypothetical protein ROMU108268_20075 [Roseomonas mucosa]